MVNKTHSNINVQELDQKQLLRSMLRDNAQRARVGSAIYPITWLVIGYYSGWHAEQPTIFIQHLLFLVVFACLRFWVLTRVTIWADTHLTPARIAYLTVILVNALHLGITTALAETHPQWATMQVPLQLLLCSVAAAGTSLLSIDAYLRYLFPSFCLLPIAFVIALNPDTGQAIVAILVIPFMIFLMVSSGSVYRDYWNSLQMGELLSKRASEYHQLSITDKLTGLHNRLYFDEYFTSEWLRAYRAHQPISILLIDLDHFKQINDLCGHAFGDYCLENVAATMRKNLRRSGDLVARFSGEEFIFLLPNTDFDGARSFAENIRQVINAKDIESGSNRVKLSASIGVASIIPNNAYSEHRLVKMADKALNKAKELGRNRVEPLIGEKPPTKKI